jgi:hypothetical protein
MLISPALSVVEDEFDIANIREEIGISSIPSSGESE